MNCAAGPGKTARTSRRRPGIAAGGWLRAVVCSALALGFVRSAAAQLPEDRYELGRRIRRFEVAWETAEASARLASQDEIDRAVRSFFALRFRDAAAAVDRAWRITTGHDAASPDELWAAALAWRAERAAYDENEPQIRWRIAPHYELTTPMPEAAEVRLSLHEEPSGPAVAAAIGRLADGVFTCEPLEAPGSAGDYWLQAEVQTTGGAWPLGLEQLSLVERMAERAEALEAAAASVPADAQPTHASTLKLRAELLGRLARGEPYEAGLPAAALFRESELLAEAVQSGAAFFHAGQSGEFWLSLRTPQQDVPTRLFVPASAASQSPRPLVIALHGFGGSENMFFFAYGAGKAVRLAQERGWLFAAPRLPILGLNCSLDDYVDALAALYPVDRERVFVIGHSMGAAAAIEWAQEAQAPPAALVPLGGGGRLTAPQRLRDVPTFIGIGSRDFLLRQASALHETLQEAGVRQVIYREYEGIEHLTIVQAALEDVYGFFDAVAAERADSP